MTRAKALDELAGTGTLWNVHLDLLWDGGGTWRAAIRADSADDATRTMLEQAMVLSKHPAEHFRTHPPLPVNGPPYKLQDLANVPAAAEWMLNNSAIYGDLSSAELFQMFPEDLERAVLVAEFEPSLWSDGEHGCIAFGGRGEYDSENIPVLLLAIQFEADTQGEDSAGDLRDFARDAKTLARDLAEASAYLKKCSFRLFKRARALELLSK